MSYLYHLRLDVHRIQKFIFSVPILKYMLGANSCVGELFSHDLLELMPPTTNSYFRENLIPDQEYVYKLFNKNILSSSGGHFEAIFDDWDSLLKFANDAIERINTKAPGLEYSISYREFKSDMKYKDFENLTRSNISISGSNKEFVDAPFYEICQYDGESIGVGNETDNNSKKVYGNPKKIMENQAKRFSKLDTSDSVSQFYKQSKIDPKRITTDLGTLVKQGKSPKNNMLAYIKADGNAMGERFRHLRNGLKETPIMEAFVQIESFWHENRKHMSDLLSGTLQPFIRNSDKYNVLPFILFMMGGDDLFLVCTPELALEIAEHLTEKKENSPSISVGIAFTKYTYPIAQSHKIAEMCLEMAKAAGYAQKDGEYIEPYIDWHVNFDSVFQDIKDIRRSSYMLSYLDGDFETVEILSKRPYNKPDLTKLREEVSRIAKDLDSDNPKVSNNKIKTYRSVLKNGYRDVKYMRKMLGIDEDNELSGFLSYNAPQKNYRIDNSLDKIELIDFYRTQKREGVQHAEN